MKERLRGWSTETRTNVDVDVDVDVAKLLP
jgi:hypothetical protein